MISRREFLKTLGAGVFSAILPDQFRFISKEKFSSILIDHLPLDIREIIDLIPNLRLNAYGYLYLYDQKGAPQGLVSQIQTKWNLLRSKESDKLRSDASWGIVLHWFGDTEYGEKDIEFYLRGFNGLRKVENYETRTSSHFLVGDSIPSLDKDETRIGIVQTQIPAPDGTPYLASHLRQLNIDLHKNKGNYFVRALYELRDDSTTVFTLLQEMFDGRYIDPNERTIAIDITGYDFDQVERSPSKQKIANVIAIVWAVMKRYKIPSTHILGHHELQIGKADPGKKFLALVKFLIGVKTLIENDSEMKTLVFGPHIIDKADEAQMPIKYFQFVRDYLVLIANPRQVSEWELWSKYWNFLDQLDINSFQFSPISKIYAPLYVEYSQIGKKYLQPENHDGVDLYTNDRYSQLVRLVANGVCLHNGINDTFHGGKMVVFKHRFLDGREIISIYGHLVNIFDLEVGKVYPGGSLVGSIKQDNPSNNSFLHFSVAYGSTWDTFIQKNDGIPLNIGPTLIKNYFINPDELLKDATNRQSYLWREGKVHWE